MRAYVETLPHSCLVVLQPSSSSYYSLAKTLCHVLRGKHRSVWVDCRHLAALPAEAVCLLRQCARRLWQHGGYLVLCHLPEATRAVLPTDTSQPLAASLLDAQQYGLDCPKSLGL